MFVALALPPVAVAAPPAPPVALPLVAELSPPKLMTCPSGEERVWGWWERPAAFAVLALPPLPPVPSAAPPLPVLLAWLVPASLPWPVESA